MSQPAIAFLEDEFNLTRNKAVALFGGVTFLLCHAAIFFLGKGVVDELDFWGGTFCLVVFATIEVVLFGWVFGIEKAWEEVHHGADLRIPKIYKFIIKYVTPVFLFIILGTWFFQEWLPIISMKNVPEANRFAVMLTRTGLVGIFVVLATLVKIAWKRRKKDGAK